MTLVLRNAHTCRALRAFFAGIRIGFLGIVTATITATGALGQEAPLTDFETSLPPPHAPDFVRTELDYWEPWRSLARNVQDPAIRERVDVAVYEILIEQKAEEYVWQDSYRLNDRFSQARAKLAVVRRYALTDLDLALFSALEIERLLSENPDGRTDERTFEAAQTEKSEAEAMLKELTLFYLTYDVPDRARRLLDRVSLAPSTLFALAQKLVTQAQTMENELGARLLDFVRQSLLPRIEPETPLSFEEALARIRFYNALGMPEAGRRLLLRTLTTPESMPDAPPGATPDTTPDTTPGTTEQERLLRLLPLGVQLDGKKTGLEIVRRLQTIPYQVRGYSTLARLVLDRDPLASSILIRLAYDLAERAREDLDAQTKLYLVVELTQLDRLEDGFRFAATEPDLQLREELMLVTALTLLQQGRLEQAEQFVDYIRFRQNRAALFLALAQQEQDAQTVDRLLNRMLDSSVPNPQGEQFPEPILESVIQLVFQKISPAQREAFLERFFQILVPTAAATPAASGAATGPRVSPWEQFRHTVLFDLAIARADIRADTSRAAAETAETDAWLAALWRYETPENQAEVRELHETILVFQLEQGRFEQAFTNLNALPTTPDRRDALLAQVVSQAVIENQADMARRAIAQIQNPELRVALIVEAIPLLNFARATR